MANDRPDRPATPTDRRNAPMPSERSRAPAPASARSEIDAFLAKVKGLAPSTAPGLRGRLIFALDATMSRQPTWDTACRLQADMFHEAAAIGGLDVQLVYYRGLHECRASRWVSQAERLAELMSGIDCRGGHTQIGKVIAHARRETQGKKVQAAGLRRRCHGGEASTISVMPPASSGCSACRPSCSRRATIRSPSRRSARSRG